MLMTTGYDFQGYFIIEYLDVVFDEMMVGLGFGKSIASAIDNVFSSFTGTEATEMINKLNDVKYQLRRRVIQKAEKLGANALIGIDFESSKLGDLIMVSMTATAVVIDKIISPLPQTEGGAQREAEREAEQQRREEMLRIIKEKEDKYINSKESAEEVINKLQEYETVREMHTFVCELKEEIPFILTEEIMKQADNCLTVERIYGTRGAKIKFLGIIKDAFAKYKN